MTTIYKDFIKAQKEFGPALKTSTNPHFRSKYADLSACVEAVIDGLNNNNFALIQNTGECDNGVCVETILLHESGESIKSGQLRVPAQKQDPQGYGSALTYARRYSLMTVCGIAPEDDDGHAGSNTNNTNKYTQPTSILSKKIEDIQSLTQSILDTARIYANKGTIELTKWVNDQSVSNKKIITDNKQSLWEIAKKVDSSLENQ
jgi:hypothetical protein